MADAAVLKPPGLPEHRARGPGSLALKSAHRNGGVHHERRCGGEVATVHSPTRDITPTSLASPAPPPSLSPSSRARAAGGG
eukprot:CAMPEP_0172608180 /NCGR_PEP_ID=MMETSP1068-20121228/28282_1 /TAXON_ID=35684 /ORGANISM="Pseudopedinella elastica, Strain CCMP716" /LENGTH=80 /DNA_ID=CAMNT_0013411361 /DNA_START=85 /DNA_END=324 /DNA_ORIENTATION=-